MGIPRWRCGRGTGRYDVHSRHGREAPRLPPLPPEVTAVHVWRSGDALRGLVRSGSCAPRPVPLGDAQAWEGARRRLAFHEARARRSRDAGAALDGALADLATEVLGPLGAAAWWPRVCLVLDPSVPDLPWEVLPVEGRPLAAVRDLLRVPALGVRGRSGPRAVGASAFAIQEPDLPGVEEETLALGPDVEVVAGEAATRARVAQALASKAVVHLAGHGYDAEEAPGLGGVRVADGWFGTADLPPRVAAELVVLAACRTGRETGTAGEAWGGLPAALLARGARRVLWTADEVEDALTVQLMRRFHAERRGRPATAAFGRAIEDVRGARGHAGGLLPFRLSGVIR